MTPVDADDFVDNIRGLVEAAQVNDREYEERTRAARSVRHARARELINHIRTRFASPA